MIRDGSKFSPLEIGRAQAKGAARRHRLCQRGVLRVGEFAGENGDDLSPIIPPSGRNS